VAKESLSSDRLSFSGQHCLGSDHRSRVEVRSDLNHA
jgi:hypothetical protein